MKKVLKNEGKACIEKQDEADGEADEEYEDYEEWKYENYEEFEDCLNEKIPELEAIQEKLGNEFSYFSN